jgi:hypothetical protein
MNTARVVVGKIVFAAIRAAWRCLTAYLISIYYMEGNNMLTVNINGKKHSLWGTIAQMTIAGIASYGMAKAADPETGWVQYRDAMLSNMAQVALPYAIQSIPGMADQADQNQQVTVNQ